MENNAKSLKTVVEEKAGAFPILVTFAARKVLW